MNSHFLKRVGAACCCAAVAVSALVFTGPSENEKAAAAQTDNYAKLLQYSLYFYDANMCGNVSSTTGMEWRGDCHTGDEVPGGYHDAGDHAMFGQPQGYAASTLGWSYYEYKDVYDSLGLTGHFTTVSKHFTDFFKASTQLNGDTVSNFLYQKGDGNEDHNYWGPPEQQEQQVGTRKMYWTNSGASDIAAEYAAALALDYINFGDEESLKYAEALYRFSTQYNQITSDGPQGFYNSTSCVDEQAWAAGWLYIATQNEQYKNDCASKQAEYLGWVHGWETVALGAACVYAEITNDWSKVTGYISQQATGSNYYALDDWGSARYNCSLQFTALVAQKHGAGNYSDWCKGQMSYLLGDNPFNVCFVTGFADNSAKNCHHRAASGYMGYTDSEDAMNGANTYHPTKSHVLIGALAGGPTKGGQYTDVMDDYTTNEVALDYNAGLVGAAAGLYDAFKTGSTETSIVGVKPFTLDGPEETTTTTTESTTTTTTTEDFGSSATTTTTTDAVTDPNGGAGSNVVEKEVNKEVNYNELPESDRMIGFLYEDLGVDPTTKAKLLKVEFNISSNQPLKTWQGAFGTSTTVEPEYWAQTNDEQVNWDGSSNSGTITWEVPSDIADIIQYGYGGEVKIGFWWIEPAQFTIDSVKLTFDDAASGSTTTITTTTTTTTTTEPRGLTGDLNLDGDVTIADAVMLSRYLSNAGSVTLSDEARANAECDGSGSLDNGDLSALLEVLTLQRNF